MTLKDLSDDADGFAIRAAEEKFEKRDGPALEKMARVAPNLRRASFCV